MALFDTIPHSESLTPTGVDLPENLITTLPSIPFLFASWCCKTWFIKNNCRRSRVHTNSLKVCHGSKCANLILDTETQYCNKLLGILLFYEESQLYEAGMYVKILDINLLL